MTKVLDDGFVEVVDVMGSDSRIAEAARLTSQSDKKDDRNLIRYLMRHRHTTPFEFCVMCFKVRCPMDVWRQWIRHRTASVNEYSTRYSEAIDSAAGTKHDKWRLQSKSNRQGSSGDFVTEWPEGFKIDPNLTDGLETAGEYLSQREEDLQIMAQDVYKERLKFGVAKEQARKDLPLSTYTEAYWQINLHNLLHFLDLRMDSHAQYEIRCYAKAMGKMVKEHFPITWEAFVDYRLHALHLNKLDILAMKQLMAVTDPDQINEAADRIQNERERKEFINKMELICFVAKERPHG